MQIHSIIYAILLMALMTTCSGIGSTMTEQTDNSTFTPPPHRTSPPTAFPKYRLSDTRRPMRVGTPSTTIQPTQTPTPQTYAVKPSRFSVILTPGYQACGAISRDGRYAAIQEFAGAGLDEAQMLVWSTDTWSVVWQASVSNFCSSLEFSPSSDLVASGILAAGLKAHIIVTTRSAYDGHYDRGIIGFYDALDMSFSADGDILAVANGYGFLYRLSHVRRFIENYLDDIGSDDPWQVLKPPDESDYVVAVEFSPKAQLIVLGTNEGNILMWEVEATQPTKVIQAQPRCASQPSARIRALAFSQDGTMLASTVCSDSVAVYDVESQVLIDTQTLPEFPTSLAFALNGQTLAVGMEDMVLLWDIGGVLSGCILDSEGHYATAVGFSADGRHVLAVTRIGAIAEWDTSECQEE
jgi:WD40 repeat protein